MERETERERERAGGVGGIYLVWASPAASHAV